MQTFRYDLASFTEPRIILIENDCGKRSDTPRLGYVVLPSAWGPMRKASYRMPAFGEDNDTIEADGGVSTP